MATRKNPKVQLPKQWTTAQVRVNPQGKVQVKIAKNKIQNPNYEEEGRRLLGFKPKKPSKRGRYSAYTSEEKLQKALARRKRKS